MGTSLVVQWLRFQAPNAVGEKGLGSIPGLGTGSHMPQLRPSIAKLKKKNSGNSTNDNKYTWVFCSTKIRTKHRKRGKEKNIKSGER